MEANSVAKSHRDSIALFAVLSWLHMLVMTWPYARANLPEITLNIATLFNVLVWSSYSVVYLAPILITVSLGAYLLPRARKTLAVLAVGGTAASLLFIQTDRTIYDLYNFHFNGFVLNLLSTPGGVDSLGSGSETYVSIAAITLRVLVIQILAFIVGAKFGFAWPSNSVRYGFSIFLLAMLSQSMLFGLSGIRNDGAILESAKAYPFYASMKFRGIAEKFGFKTDRKKDFNAVVDNGSVTYPLEPLNYSVVKRPSNIVLLVAESLRWDRLTPEIMPNTWALAQRSQHFLQHYSSGNGTREGLFGMFYGLYGSYWDKFLHAQRGPLLMDRVQALNYQIDLRTSARFSYPEFNKTLFANVPLRFQHEASSELNAWENDEANASAVINFMAQRDPSRPFMSFFFLESTHARYSFPESAAIAKPYLQDVDYGDMSKASLAPKIGELLNRYTNSAHWIDAQVGRIFDYLEKNNLLDNTIVIVTGDHGEEFLEKGFWGNNSSFVEEQTHTPMVVSMPGKGHAEITRLSSHIDIATTLLQHLGAPSDSRSYSLGRNLFDESPRPYLVISDWHSISVRTADMKYRIPYTNRGADHWQPTNLNDAVYTQLDTERVLDENRKSIIDAIQTCSLFSRKPALEKNGTAVVLAAPAQPTTDIAIHLHH